MTQRNLAPRSACEHSEQASSSLHRRISPTLGDRSVRPHLVSVIRSRLNGQLRLRPLLISLMLSLAARPAYPQSDAVCDNGSGAWSDRVWVDPPQSCRPLVRWWWPGGQITTTGITAELQLLGRLGFGGVEIQPFAFGITEDAAVTTKVRSVGTDPFLEKLNHALSEAQKGSLHTDLTISSGWGLGGLLDCIACTTHQLLMEEFDVEGPVQLDRPLPKPQSTPYQTNFVGKLLGLTGPVDPSMELQAVLAARLLRLEGSDTVSTAVLTGEMLDLSESVRDGRLSVSVPDGTFRIFVIYGNRTNTRLAGAAYPGDPAAFRTVDHLDEAGLNAFRRSYLDLLIGGLHLPPRHYFVDSFEFLADLPWTPSFLESFAAAKGYDLTPYLPLLFDHGGDFSFAELGQPRAHLPGISKRVREDYRDVRANLFRTELLEPLLETIHASGAGIRLQALGGYGDYLDTFAAVDVPEAEDFGLRGNYDFLKLASSAAHVAGRHRSSNEAFVKRLPDSGARGLGEDAYHWLAGGAFASGINQLVYHGRAYPFVDASGEPWYPFERLQVTTRLDESNPIWPRLPHLNATFARLTYAMTRGRADTRVAWLMTGVRPPELDGDWPDHPGPYPEISPIARVLRQNVIGYDRVSRRQLVSSGKVCESRACIGVTAYDLVLVDPGAVASLDWLRRLEDFAAAGVPVVLVGAEPERARGLSEARSRDSSVHRAMERLRDLSAYHRVADVRELRVLLEDLLATRLVRPVAPSDWPFASSGRALEDEYVLLIFNGWDSPRSAVAEVGDAHFGEIMVLDPENPSSVQRMAPSAHGRIVLAVPGRRSLVLRFRRVEEPDL